MVDGEQKGREEARVDAPVNVSAVLLDIEHAVVEDDPRTWSSTRKVCESFYINGCACSPCCGVVAGPRDCHGRERPERPWGEYIHA